MPSWSRTTSLSPARGPRRREIWSLVDEGEAKREFAMDVHMGKNIDLASLKQDIVADFAKHLEKVKDLPESLVLKGAIAEVAKCPVCGNGDRDSWRQVLEIYGFPYVQCRECSHVFVRTQPSAAALKDFYAQSESYASTYTNKETGRLRVEQISIPKCKWMIERFRDLNGRPPKKVLDVGAGGGHFVEACKELGLEAVGVEISEYSRNYCKDVFGHELVSQDFCQSWERFTGVDIVTFWGVVEHTSNPLEFLKAGRKLLTPGSGMVVAEVPRWEAFGTAVQGRFPESVVRHLEPTGHINAFTDQSLASAFIASGFQPFAAWYFGMDVYELVMQTAFACGAPEVTAKILPHGNALQGCLDMAHLSDEIVLVGSAA